MRKHGDGLESQVYGWLGDHGSDQSYCGNQRYLPYYDFILLDQDTSLQYDSRETNRQNQSCEGA